MIYKFTAFILLSFLFSSYLNAANIEELDVTVLEQELSIKRIFAQGPNFNSNLIIWVAPGFGVKEREMIMSDKLATLGVEVWHVDLSESLFLPKSTSTMRSLDGKYLAGLIEYAYKKTNKNITLLTRSYGAIPVLRAIRMWQVEHKGKASYLQGAILFSPELYSHVPELGLEPEFVNITDATNMPLMIYQGGKRSNRWQVKKLLKKLQDGGSQVYINILKGVNGIFYTGDVKPETLKQNALMPRKIVSAINLLTKTEKPIKAAVLKSKTLKKSKILDIKLKRFKADPNPHLLDLVDVFGKQIKINDYKGKVTVVNFWATWCPPCVEEIPSLNNLREKMQDEKFELISVNYGENQKTVADFMKKVNVDFSVLLDPEGRQSAKWNVLVFPSTFIIGTDGKIKYGVNAAIHWDDPSVVKQIKALLK